MTARTLVDLYRVALRERPNPDAFRERRDGSYHSVSSEEFARLGEEIACGLRVLGLRPGDRVALLAESRLEWAAADLGILSAGLVSVPVYPSLAAATVEHILRDSGARLLIASTPEQGAKAGSWRSAPGNFPVILMEGDPRGVGGRSWEELRVLGRQAGTDFRSPVPVLPEDLATLIYTSGTTGPPKGVMLTHGNLASNAEAALQVLPLRADDVYLSYLPLSHVLERTGGLYCMMLAGVTIAYAESMDTVVENFKEVRPTVLVSVPRLYEKMYARILESAVEGGPLRRWIFHWARDVGLARGRALLAGRRPGLLTGLAYRIADRLLYARLRARFGGRLRFFISGGAPLAPEIATFFYAAGLPILEGYGLTETSPILSLNTLLVHRPGTVGKPIPGVEIRIAPDGEILARSPGVMKGYHNLPEATLEALKDGWFHTGDIGHLDEDGFLVITDRKKDLIVTAGGKNVAPQPIENRLKTDRFLSEVVVLGDRRPYLIALLVPNFENLESYARHKGMVFRDRAELARDPRIREFLQRRVAHHQEGSASYETIKKIHLLDRALIIGVELTPSLKVKRKEMMRRFEQEIAALYEG